MAQISRLKDEEISNGNLINADDLDSELNQLIDESNQQDNRVTALESGDVTLDGVKTLLKTPKLDALQERTPGGGVRVERVIHRNGAVVLEGGVSISAVDINSNQVTTTIAHGLSTATAVRFATDNTLPSPLSSGSTYYARVINTTTLTVHPSAADATAGTNTIDITTAGIGNHVVLADIPSPADGSVWYNAVEQQFKGRRNGVTRNFLLSGDTDALPKRSILGPRPAYVSATSVKIPTGFSCRDDADSFNIHFTADATVAITSSGANGLDAGSEASGTMYYLWAIADSNGVNNPAGLLSVSGTSPTLPSGYNKKRLVGFAANDSSSNFIPFRQYPNLYRYLAEFGIVSGKPTSLTVTTGDVGAAAFLPISITRDAILAINFNQGNTGTSYIEPKGTASQRITWGYATTVNGPGSLGEHVLPTDSNGVYNMSQTNNHDNYIQVVGFHWNEGAQ